MKYIIVLSLFITFICDSYAQSRNGFALGVHYSAKLSQPSQIDYSTKNEITNTIGFSVIQFYGKRFFIKTGLNYSFRNVRFSNIPHLKNSTDSFGHPFLETVGYMDIRKKYRFLNVPVLANYMLMENDKKTNILFSLGLEVDYIIKHEAFANSSFDGLHYLKMKGSDFENPWRPAIHIGIGISHRLSENFIAIIKPYYLNYFLENPAPQFKGDVNNFGISMEILYSFD